MPTPKFKVYRGKTYVAACVHAEDAAILVSGCNGGQVRYDHAIPVWNEGSEDFLAGESYDEAAEIMYNRIQAYQEKHYRKMYPGRELPSSK